MRISGNEIAELIASITSAVEQAIASYRSGERFDEFGAPMRYLTRLEASKIARNDIEAFFKADHRRVFDYIIAHPDILEMRFGSMTLEEALVYGPTESLLYRTMLDIRHLVLDQAESQTLNELLDDILATIEGFSNPVDGAAYTRVSKLIGDFRSTPDAGSFEQIGSSIGSMATHLRQLNLIRERSGDPYLETALIAGRRLREAQDRINLVLELERFNALCDTKTQASQS